LLLSFVIATQGDHCVIALILHNEPLTVFQIVGVRHRFSLFSE
jgi:hypothetical protein